MPTFDFECPTKACFLGLKRDVYLPLLSSEPPTCADCGKVMERVWSITKRDATSVYPYTTKNITGKPIEIRSPGHLKEIEKRHGVRLRDDAAYVTQRWEGYDPMTKKHVYKESGAGMPGCWI